MDKLATTEADVRCPICGVVSHAVVVDRAGPVNLHCGNCRKPFVAQVVKRHG